MVCSKQFLSQRTELLVEIFVFAHLELLGGGDNCVDRVIVNVLNLYTGRVILSIYAATSHLGILVA